MKPPPELLPKKQLQPEPPPPQQLDNIIERLSYMDLIIRTIRCVEDVQRAEENHQMVINLKRSTKKLNRNRVLMELKNAKSAAYLVHRLLNAARAIRKEGMLNPKATTHQTLEREIRRNTAEGNFTD